MSRESFAVTVEAWGRFLRQLDETGVEIPGHTGKKDELEEMYSRAKQLVAERNAHEAAKQAATHELRQILDAGRMKHTVLRQNLKIHLGDTSEMLTAYGIRPNRGRPKRRKAPAPEE
jgi:tRNA C32,U32 (ribose-2'-O)-methylase TrmJ